jgi:hypothetical protein
MYLADWETYSSSAPFQKAYNKDKRILFCPDNSFEMRVGSSYTYRESIPPTFAPLAQVKELLPQTVIVYCDNHTGRKRDDGQSPFRFPHHIVLRANGAVQRIHVSSIQRNVSTGRGPWLTDLYPGDPGYERSR